MDTFTGTGTGGATCSSSSSRLTLDATLESALIMFDVRPFVLLFVEFVNSMLLLERGVAERREEKNGRGQQAMYTGMMIRKSPVFELGLLLLLVFSMLLGVLLFWPRELEVESGISSEGSSQP